MPTRSRPAMRSSLTAIALTLAATPIFAAAPPTTHLGAEWMVPGNGASAAFSLVDASTGAVRIAAMDANGSVKWPHHIATGVPAVSDVAAGKLIAITSPTANRVVLLDADSANPFPIILPELAGIGPSGVASIGPSVAPELLIASSANGSTIGALETRVDLESTADFSAKSNQPGIAFRRAQPVVVPGSTTSICVVTETADGGLTQAWLVERSGTSHALGLIAKLEAGFEFTTGIASLNFPTLPFAVAQVAGSDEAVLMSFSLPLNTASTVDDARFLFPHPMSSIMPVTQSGAGPINEGVIATHADGSEARWMRVNATRDALEDTGHVFPAEPGMAVTGLAVVPGLGVVKLNATAPGMPTTSYNAYQWDGSGWKETDSGMLPDPADAAASHASLLFFNANPFAENDARLLGVQTVRDWTSLASYPDGLPASVVRETFTSATSGLVTSGTTTLKPPAGTKHIIANQAEPAISITALDGFERLLAPGLRVSPDSGEYDTTFQVTAVFDATRYRLRFRRDGGNWLLFHTAVPVAWTTTLQFMLEDKTTGANGPIVTREYTLDPAAIADVDSDGDGVPDYVELHFGLDPFAGADSDGDGFSDLDEILQGNNPADPLDFPSISLNLAPGGGMRVVATATDFAAREIANGEDLTARAAGDGSLLARAAVGVITPALPDGGNRGARLASNSSPPFDELISLSTPLYFNNNTTSARSGREIIGFIPSDRPPVPETSFIPAPGMSLADAANAWVAATIAALGDTPLALKRAVLTPSSAAVAVLLEDLIHSAAAAQNPNADPMPALAEFTVFHARNADVTRARLTADDLSRLRAAGFSPRAALAIADDAGPGLATIADTIYQRHASASASTPDMVMPIDALRVMLRGDLAPQGYVGAVSAAVLDDARAVYQAALADAGAAFRPSATWVVEIAEPPVAPGIYQRVDDAVPVALLRPTGEQFLLDQGLGLRPGSRFTVVGFIDTPASSGFPTMEVTGAALTFEPASSDRDEDGNLLDDEWEKFFFGATGQDPGFEPHGNGYSLLQYFLDGVDPRTGTLPDGPAVNLVPQLPIFEPTGDGGYTLDFVFPASYSDRVTFLLERSQTLAPGSFVGVPDASFTPLGGDEIRFHISETQAPLGNAFFRVRMALVP